MIAVHLVTVSQMMWFLSLKGINKNNKRKRNPHSGSTSQPRPYVYNNSFPQSDDSVVYRNILSSWGKKKYHENLLIFEMCDWDNGTIPWWQDRWLDIFFRPIRLVEWAYWDGYMASGKPFSSCVNHSLLEVTRWKGAFDLAAITDFLSFVFSFFSISMSILIWFPLKYFQWFFFF